MYHGKKSLKKPTNDNYLIAQSLYVYFLYGSMDISFALCLSPLGVLISVALITLTFSAAG